MLEIDESNHERLLHFVSQRRKTHRRGQSMQGQLPSSAKTVLVGRQFGSMRASKVHPMKNDCELCE